MNSAYHHIVLGVGGIGSVAACRLARRGGGRVLADVAAAASWPTWRRPRPGRRGGGRVLADVAIDGRTGYPIEAFGVHLAAVRDPDYRAAQAPAGDTLGSAPCPWPRPRCSC